MSIHEVYICFLVVIIVAAGDYRCASRQKMDDANFLYSKRGRLLVDGLEIVCVKLPVNN